MVNYFREFARTGPFTDAAGAIRLILAAGGVPVWAHPKHADSAEIIRLRDLGLAGLEVITPKHDQALRKYLNTICAEFGLIPTGGAQTIMGVISIPSSKVGRSATAESVNRF